MKHLKHPIAYQSNREDGCTRHFFEGRFYSGALLDESAVIAAMAYVDLNPIRARIVHDIEEYQAVSGYKRSKVASNTPARLDKAVEPLISGLKKKTAKTYDYARSISRYSQRHSNRFPNHQKGR